MVALILDSVLVFLPLPFITIEIFMALDGVLAMVIFICLFIKWEDLTLFSRFVRAFCFISIGVAIATTRTFLTIKSVEEQILLARILGELICKDNVIAGSFFVIIFGVGLLAFFSCFVSLTVKEIKHECYLNPALKSLVDDCNQMENGFLFFTGTIKAFVFLLIISLLGGAAVGIIGRDMFWKDALKEYAMLSCGYTTIFMLPLFLVGISFYIYVRRKFIFLFQ